MASPKEKGVGTTPAFTTVKARAEERIKEKGKSPTRRKEKAKERTNKAKRLATTVANKATDNQIVGRSKLMKEEEQLDRWINQQVLQHQNWNYDDAGTICITSEEDRCTRS